MKKLILAASLSIAFINAEARTKIVRSGSLDGVHYDRISETHTLFNNTLFCSRPGATMCGWSQPNRVIGSDGEYEVKDLEDWVESQILSGLDSGSMLYGNSGIRITWVSEGTDRDITIEDYAG